MQALCELYDRPAEIWAYDAENGATRLRTFHEASGFTPSGAARVPMRLSYYGGGHYDSLVPSGGGGGGVGGSAPPLLAEAPGVVEARAVEMARQRQRAAAQAVGLAEEETKRRSDEEATEAEAMHAALRLSRREFDAGGDLETALELSAQHHIQEELLRSAVAQSEDELLRKAVEDSIKVGRVAGRLCFVVVWPSVCVCVCVLYTEPEGLGLVLVWFDGSPTIAHTTMPGIGGALCRGGAAAAGDARVHPGSGHRLRPLRLLCRRRSREGGWGEGAGQGQRRRGEDGAGGGGGGGQGGGGGGGGRGVPRGAADVHGGVWCVPCVFFNKYVSTCVWCDGSH